MIWLMVFLCFLGFVLILLEVVLPHGISFSLGAVLIALGIFLVWREDHRVGLAAAAVVVPVTGVAAWWVFRSGIQRIALNNEGDNKVVDDLQDPPLGETLVVTQPLRPTGTVKWGERRLTARTLQVETEVPVGGRVKVCGRDSIYLLVEPAE